MCVGLSAKVVRINEGMAVVDADGAKREVSAELLDELEPGDYVMVHAGVAIAKITDEDESETDQLMEEFIIMEEKKKTAREIIEGYDGPPVRIMEVCGTHTHEIFRLGIRKLLPEQVELISGPGCPVCVTPGQFY